MALLAPRSARGPATVPGRRWDPGRELEDLQDRVGQLMQSFFGAPLSSGAAQAPPWLVPVDIEETDDAYIVQLDLPGVRAEDVNVELRENELRISGEYKEVERVGIVRRRMRPVGQFEYLVTLPGAADPEQVDARLNEGVLTIRVTKAAASRPRQIEVKGS